MNSEAKLKLWILFIPVLFLVWSTVGLAKPEPGACLDLGALAWDDWTKADAGGSGMPAEEPLRLCAL